jgi:hypothetical protein
MSHEPHDDRWSLARPTHVRGPAPFTAYSLKAAKARALPGYATPRRTLLGNHRGSLDPTVARLQRPTRFLHGTAARAE